MDAANQPPLPAPVRPRYLDRRSPPHISTLVAMTALSALAMTIFVPSLQRMADSFGTSYGTMQLSIAIYLAMNAVLQLVVGALSDRFGRRPVILVGFALFLIATLGCIFAPNVQIFLVFRMLQAPIVVAIALSRAVVRDMFDRARSASVLGYVTMGMSIAPMLGPPLGGLLDSAFGWRATFWLLFAAGAVVMALAWADLGETNARPEASFRKQLRDYPELLRSQRFWGYNFAAALGTGSYFAYLGGASFVGERQFGLDLLTLSLLFGAPAAGYFFGNFVSARCSVAVGVDRMVMIGAALMTLALAAGLAVFLAGLGSAYLFFGFVVAVGFGNGMILPNAIAGMLSVRPHLAGTASGLGGFLQIAGGAALSALAGQLLAPANAAETLLVLMTACSAGSLLAILFVMHRARRVG